MTNIFAKIKPVLKRLRHNGRIALARGLGRYGKRILSAAQGNEAIATALQTVAPFMAARIGSVELACLVYYLKHRQSKPLPYPDEIKKTMHDNAGFFPADDSNLDRFAQEFLASVKSVDLLAVWFNQGEDLVCREFCPQAQLAELTCLEPYYFAQPWSAMLAGKSVLVVHPFDRSIENQYFNKREKIFTNPTILPRFTLQTVRTVLSLGDQTSEYSDWFAALESMKKQIAAKDFDIAIIGAGAYGLPLAAYVKSLGKKAIHLGGATQILFGIKGKRWDNAPQVAAMYNENWVRPWAQETPRGAEKVEGSTYW